MAADWNIVDNYGGCQQNRFACTEKCYFRRTDEYAWVDSEKASLEGCKGCDSSSIEINNL